MIDRIPVDPAVLTIDEILFEKINEEGLFVPGSNPGSQVANSRDQSIDRPMARSWSRMVAMF